MTRGTVTLLTSEKHLSAKLHVCGLPNDKISETPTHRVGTVFHMKQCVVPKGQYVVTPAVSVYHVIYLYHVLDAGFENFERPVESEAIDGSEIQRSISPTDDFNQWHPTNRHQSFYLICLAFSGLSSLIFILGHLLIVLRSAPSTSSGSILRHCMLRHSWMDDSCPGINWQARDFR